MLNTLSKKKKIICYVTSWSSAYVHNSDPIFKMWLKKSSEVFCIKLLYCFIVFVNVTESVHTAVLTGSKRTCVMWECTIFKSNSSQNLFLMQIHCHLHTAPKSLIAISI